MICMSISLRPDLRKTGHIVRPRIKATVLVTGESHLFYSVSTDQSRVPPKREILNASSELIVGK
jgi:hypothetical protein